jgi:hypothetical protein
MSNTHTPATFEAMNVSPYGMGMQVSSLGLKGKLISTDICDQETEFTSMESRNPLRI